MSQAVDVKNPGLVVFGGAFDPPHQGHVESVLAISQRFPEAKIIIVPGRLPAGAGGVHKKPTLSFDERIELCKLAFDIEPLKSRIEISGIENELPAPNFTINTLEKIHKKNQKASLGFLVGQDQLKSFHNWHEPKRILRLAQMVVIRRVDGEKKDLPLQKDVERLAYFLDSKFKWVEPDNLLYLEGLRTCVFLIQATISAAKSSAIQEFLAKNQPIPDQWLPEKVARYINENQLFKKPGPY
jgi:nicotinate (nicotinamide) nucleotide adenylyltransferase